MPLVSTRQQENLWIVTLERPECRNAVDAETAEALHRAFVEFDRRDDLTVAILHGSGGHFCAGADLKAVSQGRGNRVAEDGPGPMGPTRLQLSKPVIAAIEGYAVAGGLELALWCDLRVAAETATLGVFCRRFGVPLIDGGTIRLPRLIGQSRALDLILTGRHVAALEALSIGLVNRLAPDGAALEEAIKLAKDIAAFPQACLRADRLSVYNQWELHWADALRQETIGGLAVIRSGETFAGASQFAAGQGRHGRFESGDCSD